MEAIAILFKEYDTLRAEILNRTNNGYQLIGIGAALGAGLLTWFGAHGVDRMFWISGASFVLVFAAFTWAMHRDISFAAGRLRQLESEINRLAGAELLQWETRWGGATSGWIKRKRPVTGKTDVPNAAGNGGNYGNGPA
jgi:hypothetical protein